MLKVKVMFVFYSNINLWFIMDHELWRMMYYIADILILHSTS